MTDEQPTTPPVIRLDVNREVLDSMPINEQVALMRATTDSAKTLRRRYRLYRRRGWPLFWRLFLRNYWFQTLPIVGAISVIGWIVRFGVWLWPYFDVAWTVAKALFTAMLRLP